MNKKQVETLVQFTNKILNANLTVNYFDGKGIIESVPSFTFENKNMDRKATVNAENFNFYTFIGVLYEVGFVYENKLNELSVAYKLVQ